MLILCYVWMLQFQIEFSTHNSINFQSTTNALVQSMIIMANMLKKIIIRHLLDRATITTCLNLFAPHRWQFKILHPVFFCNCLQVSSSVTDKGTKIWPTFDKYIYHVFQLVNIMKYWSHYLITEAGMTNRSSLTKVYFSKCFHITWACMRLSWASLNPSWN